VIMRTLFLSILAAFLALSYGALADAQAGSSGEFMINLSLGSRGAQVTLLQQILNRDPDTRITDTGPGSPGNETGYFGSLTKAAVARFQTKYAGDVLAPAGLAQGSGYVGFYTRAKLNALASSGAISASTPAEPPVVSPPPASAVQPAPAVPASAPSATVFSNPPKNQNPNTARLDRAFAALDTAVARKNISTATAAAFKAEMAQQAATTTDIQASFLHLILQEHKTALNDSFFGEVLATTKQLLEKIFLPDRALAATGAPFGGALLWAEPCTCSGGTVWKILIEPLPPTYVVDLDYVIGSQAFASYNIPVTNYLLGFYAPGVSVCWELGTPCWPNPGEGLIEPMVGSSPL
jgi:peptidoglycan hydrolase-like protein with peptidoglycan-binding domain